MNAKIVAMNLLDIKTSKKKYNEWCIINLWIYISKAKHCFSLVIKSCYNFFTQTMIIKHFVIISINL